LPGPRSRLRRCLDLELATPTRSSPPGHSFSSIPPVSGHRPRWPSISILHSTPNFHTPLCITFHLGRPLPLLFWNPPSPTWRGPPRPHPRPPHAPTPPTHSSSSYCCSCYCPYDPTSVHAHLSISMHLYNAKYITRYCGNPLLSLSLHLQSAQVQGQRSRSSRPSPHMLSLLRSTPLIV
jgi:hypothetical protein